MLTAVAIEPRLILSDSARSEATRKASSVYIAVAAAATTKLIRRFSPGSEVWTAVEKDQGEPAGKQKHDHGQNGKGHPGGERQTRVPTWVQPAT